MSRRSSLLVLQNNAVSALTPTTLIDQVDALLDSSRIDDAALLVDQRRRELEGNLTVDPDETEELEYIYQTIGFKCFSQTLFEDAGRNLFNGALDPRILVSYYPDLYGTLFSSTGDVDVYSGVAERMPPDKNIDDLIAMNLVRNYSPHLEPNIQEAPAAVELRQVLGNAAREMLLVFLEKSRRRTRVERRKEDVRSDVVRVVDTVLAKLYALHDRIQELRTLLVEPNEVVLSEIEPSLRKLSLFSLLADLYQRQGQESKLLDLYSACAEGTYQNTDIEDPIDCIVSLLESRKDKDRKQQIKWGLWVLQKGELERGMKLLIPPDVPKRRERDRDREDDLSLLEQIASVNQAAGKRYLEYVVVTKRSPSPELHTRLALLCIDELLQCLEDAATMKLWRAKASSYASPRPPSSPRLSSPNPSQPQPPSPSSHLQQLPSPPLLTRHQSSQSQPFVAYFASTTPNSTSKRTRLKAILMLSGSGLYDASVVKDRLCSVRVGDSEENNESGKGKGKTINVLALESAILDGKLGQHALALSTLVHDLRDSASAETYCTLGGEVVPAKLALAVAESIPPSAPSSVELTLKEWYLGLFEPPQQVVKSKRGNVVMGGMESAMVRQRSVKDEVKKRLLIDLVDVYTRDGTLGVERTKRLLESQGVNLDVVDIMTLIPDDWPLSSLDTFLTRHFRRTLHKMHENLILKNLSTGQNLAVSERSYPVLRDAGYVIEEPDSEDQVGGEVDEKAAYVQVEEVVEKIIGRGDDFGNEKTLSPDRHRRHHHYHPPPQLQQSNEERDVEEEEDSEGVDGSNRDDVSGEGRMEERSVLGLILDDGAGGKGNWNGEDEEFGEFLG